MRISDWSSDVFSSDLALLEAAQLADAELHRPPHLPGQLRHDLLAQGQHGVDQRGAAAGALGDRQSRPIALGLPGTHEGRLDAIVARHGAAGILAVVDGRNAEGVGHGGSAWNGRAPWRSEEQTYELQTLIRISYSSFC